MGAHKGSKPWEEQQPEVAQALRQLAEAHAQQDPTFESTIAYTRLTAAQALAQMSSQGFSKTQLPSPSTMAIVLNRMGYRLRKVLKAKPKKAVRERSDDGVIARVGERRKGTRTKTNCPRQTLSLKI